MRVSLRGVLRGVCYVAILVAVAAGSAYLGRNFTGLGPTPTRSAFAGRLPGTPDGNWRRFQFFYATNRVNDEETFNNQGSKLGKEISQGTFDVRISPYMPIAPHVWFDSKHMEWARRQELSSSDFQSQLRQAVQASPEKSLLIIVWGFRDWFESAALKTAYTAYVLDINTPVLLFDWPGNQGHGPIGYAAARTLASQSGPDLGRVLADVLRNTGAEKVWLMGSSLGSQTICDALTYLVTQPDLLSDKTKLDHVVLSAPDVSAEAFDEKFSQTIKKLSNHLTAYVSSNDRALLMSHWLNGGRRLGRKAQVMVPPEDRSSEYEFEEGLELLDLQTKGAENISMVDATPVNLTRNLHHFFTDSPEFFDDLYLRLLQPDNSTSRRLHPVRTQQSATYWILWSN